MANKSDLSVPFGLGIASGIIVLIVSIVFGLAMALLGAAFGAAASALGKPGIGAGIGIWSAISLIWGIIVGIILLLGSYWIHTDSKKARTGSILLLIFSILGFFTPGMGLIVGPILGIVGGALGISKTK